MTLAKTPLDLDAPHDPAYPPRGGRDEIGNQVARDPVTIHDLHATILHLLGLDHEKLTYRFAGCEQRLTDVHGRVVKGDTGLSLLN